MAFRRSEGAHQALVAWLADYLVKNGYTRVKADLPGREQPAKISWKQTGDGHIPDASAWLNGRECIFEVETEDTISIDHTKSQLELFNAYAKQHNATLTVVVPKGTEDDAKYQVSAWGLTAMVW